MDDEKLDKVLKDIESTPTNRDPHSRKEIESALRLWSASVQAMLDGRFGKGRVVHLLVAAPTGREGVLSWISTATFPSTRAIIDALMLRFKFLDEKKITIPPEHFGG